MPSNALATPTGTITKPLMIELEGRGSLSLKPKDYVVSGGEGAIYKPSPDTIIKLYHDKDKMRRDGMPQKIHLLSQINSPFIINPKGLVYEHQQAIGYYMNFEEGESLAKVITSAYRQRENFGDKEAVILVDNMRSAVKTAHDASAVLVDANELNWIVKRKKNVVEPKLLDVDSWKIGQWDASVIMLSIRDWHTHGFNEGSDWFSWGIVTFQAFTGIHPYKGGLDGFKTNDIESRMKANKSVFTPGVRLNSAVRDFNCIPTPLLDWYQAVFQHGDRSTPPSPKDISNKAPKAAVVKRVVVNKGSGLVITELLWDSTKFIDGTPIQVYACGVVRTDTGTLFNLETGMAYSKKAQHPCEIIATMYGNLLCELSADNNLTFYLLTKDGKSTDLNSILKGQKILKYQHRLFIVASTGLVEVTVKMVGNRPLLVTLNTWQVLLNSTQWFEGVGVQDALGAMFLIAPFGERACEYVRIHELDKKKVISAFAGNRYIVATVLDNKTGTYYKYEFAMSKDYKSYTLKISDVATPDLNISLLPKGVCASIVDDGQLLINVPVNGEERLVNDSKIESSFLLFNWENRVVYIDGKKVWSLSLK